MEPARKGIRWLPLGESPAPALLEASSRAPAGASILKESPLRLVCRVQTAQGRAVVKIHLSRGLLSRLAARLGLDPARREARALLAARAAGLPAPRPLATGLAPTGETRLLLEDLGEGSTLADLLREGTLSVSSIRRTARLLARVHQAGFLHPDLHPGNLFLPQAKEDPFLLDLQSARTLGRSLRPREREKSLSFLWLTARRTLSPSLGLLFLKSYRAAFPWPSGEPLSRLGARLEGATRLLQRRTWARREDRPFRTCSEFRKTGKGRAQIFRFLPALPPEPAQVEALLQDGSLQFLRRGRRGFVARGGGWILKERDRAHAKGLWLAHYRLHQRGIPAPQALLLILQENRGILVCRDLGPLPDLFQALREAGGEGQRKLLLQGAARLAASLHAGGLRNRDLKAANLLVRKTPQGPLLLPVDLDGLSRPGKLRLSHIAADLARLAASLSALGLSWKPFLQAYLEALPPGRPFFPPLDSLEKRLATRLERLGPRP